MDVVNVGELVEKNKVVPRTDCLFKRTGQANLLKISIFALQREAKEKKINNYLLLVVICSYCFRENKKERKTIDVIVVG